MEALYELKDMLCKELKEYGKKGELTPGTLEVVDKLAHATKNLDKIIEKYEEEDEGYSGRSYADGMGGSYARRGRYSREGGSYGRDGGGSYGGGSYARGRGGNSRRDSMGRYSREGGYSRAEKEEIAAQLEELVPELPPEAKPHVMKALEKIEQM